MGDRQHYANAPITEAVIDLRVEPRAGLALADLEGLRSSREVDYPSADKTFEAVGTVEIKTGVSAAASAHQRQTGYKFTGREGKNICQVRLDGFTFSRLAPYERWEVFRDEARRLWDLYREQVRPEKVIRLAVRYINRIDVPAKSVDLKDYFRTSPEISPDLPQHLAGFFMQLRIPQDDLHAQLLINQTIVPPLSEGVTSIVLDIDLFRSEDVPREAEEVWQILEKMHGRKNDVFEACITDKTRELIN